MNSIEYKLLKNDKKLLLNNGMYINECFGNTLEEYDITKRKIDIYGDKYIYLRVFNPDIPDSAAGNIGYKEVGGIITDKKDFEYYLKFKINPIKEVNGPISHKAHFELVSLKTDNIYMERDIYVYYNTILYDETVFPNSPNSLLSPTIIYNGNYCSLDYRTELIYNLDQTSSLRPYEYYSSFLNFIRLYSDINIRTYIII